MAQATQGGDGVIVPGGIHGKGICGTESYGGHGDDGLMVGVDDVSGLFKDHLNKSVIP